MSKKGQSSAPETYFLQWGNSYHYTSLRIIIHFLLSVLQFCPYLTIQQSLYNDNFWRTWLSHHMLAEWGKPWKTSFLNTDTTTPVSHYLKILALWILLYFSAGDSRHVTFLNILTYCFTTNIDSIINSYIQTLQLLHITYA